MENKCIIYLYGNYFYVMRFASVTKVGYVYPEYIIQKIFLYEREPNTKWLPEKTKELSHTRGCRNGSKTNNCYIGTCKQWLEWKIM